ncbi:TIGR04283 family arsenosugar biosynthesis glycosyltransferase [Haliangium ochraceum]|uniref:Glycosyl transferase family 2 n=1 Tax=Haliangium ochraceum (strain DSM 14365 / JCM 11303 / SMP-2) TaxID=502025 RepID=D0LQ40_HALO1|nr:TIGR04283 family arsenosugar biosynthesis glycosyltransferase [Haliangium ochraceum]ACY17077.1 glycosyl transferase family 2 [Haliangium ochraceum DSM 14365]
MRVSIIVPVLDEAAGIERCARALLALEGVDERIVVDGGSSDDTAERARRHAGIRVLEAARGRAHQLNAGAAAATGDILMFVHADAALPPDAADAARHALRQPGVIAGAFRTRHMPERWRGSWRAPLLRLADLRSRYTTLPYGDQTLFLRARDFWRVGGYPELALMEDLALSRILRARGRIRVLPREVRVSGRRFEAAPWRQTLMVNAFPVLYTLGVSPERLARWYGNPR